MLFDNLTVNGASKTGRVIYHDYVTADGIFDRLGRVYRILETNSAGTPLVEYDYNGTGRLVQADYLPPGVRTGFHGNDGDDEYEGLDRFGREHYQAWYKHTAPTGIVDWTKYTYDYAGNRLTRDVDVGSNDTRDQKYTYDGLHRLLDYDQGKLVAGSITNSNKQRSWGLDQLGNWDEVYSDLEQIYQEEDRDHNLANELTGFTVPSWTVANDAAGNMTTIPQPLAPSSSFTLIYDAWNRMVEVKDGGNTVPAALDDLKTACVSGDVAAVARCDMSFHEAILMSCVGADFLPVWRWHCSQMMLAIHVWILIRKSTTNTLKFSRRLKVVGSRLR